MTTANGMLQQQITELRMALPILEEKARLGAIHFDSHSKAKDLLRWFDSGRTLSDKQILFVGRLLQRAKRKHRGRNSAYETIDAMTPSRHCDGLASTGHHTLLPASQNFHVPGIIGS